MAKVADDFFLLFSVIWHANRRMMVEQGDEVVWFYNYIENYWIQKIPLGFLSVYGCARRTNSEVECFHWGLLRKFNARHPILWVFINKLHEIINSYCVELKQVENGQETRRRKAKFSKAVDSAIRDAEEKLQNERINTTEFLIRVGGATERSFRKMELLKEFEEEEENNAPDDIDDDDNYDNTDLFCEEDHEEDYDLCSSCDEKPIAHLVQTCGDKICTNCVQKNNCQIYGCRISNNVTIHFDEVECYFHVFQCFNLDGALAYLFSICFTFSIFVISWKFCVQCFSMNPLILINFKSWLILAVHFVFLEK